MSSSECTQSNIEGDSQQRPARNVLEKLTIATADRRADASRVTPEINGSGAFLI